MKKVVTTSMAALAVLLAGGGSAAPVTERKGLTLEGAKAVVAQAVAEASKRDAGGAIAVVDEGGALLYLERIDGTFAASSNVALKKARTAAIFRRATRDLENAVRNGRISLLAVPEMTPLQGGVPILVDGQVVGAVGVSGAMTAAQDDEIATAAVRAIEASAPPIATKPDETVDPTRLTLAGARKAGSAAAAEAKRHGTSGAVAITDEGGALVYLERLDGAFPASPVVAIRKARTAARFKRSTKDFEDAIKAGRFSLAAMEEEMTPLQGGVPIVASGRVIGAVGVTGAASPQQDEDLAKAAAGAVR